MRDYPASGAGAKPSSAIVVRDGLSDAVQAQWAVPFTSSIVGWTDRYLVAADRPPTVLWRRLLLWPDGRPGPGTAGSELPYYTPVLGGDRALVMDCAQGRITYDSGSSEPQPQTWPLPLGTATPGCVGRHSQVVAVSEVGHPLWQGAGPIGLSPDGRFVVLADLRVVAVDGGAVTAMAPSLAAALPADLSWEVGTPLLVGFWHDARQVEITRAGVPVADCTLPAGPCTRLG